MAKNMIVLLVMIFFLVPIVFAQTINVNPSSQNVRIGDTVTVNITVNSINYLYGFDLDINYNPSILSYVGFEEGNFLCPSVNNSECHVFNPAVAGGLIKDLLIIKFGNEEGVSGNGVLVKLTFQAVGEGTSIVSFNNNGTELVGYRPSIGIPYNIEFTSYSGSVNVLSLGSCFADSECPSDGWYDNGNYQWVDTSQCTQKEQKQQDNRNYGCNLISHACEYSVLSTRWLDTGNTRNKAEGVLCNDNLYCTINDACSVGSCTGSLRNCGDELDWTDDSCAELGGGSGECRNIYNGLGPGDASKDGVVNIDDLILISSNYGKKVADCPNEECRNCDLSGDGKIGILDIVTSAVNWLRSYL